MINAAYDKLETHLKEQRETINACLVSNKHPQVEQSDSFQEIAKSLTSSSVAHDAQLMNMLDKYSNALLEMFNSKVSMKIP